MKLSAKNASKEVKAELEKEMKKVILLESIFRGLEKEADAYLQEKRRCLQHLINGYSSRTMSGYTVSNKVIKDLGKKFPKLQTEE